mgnify:CR=1 FL=1
MIHLCLRVLNNQGGHLWLEAMAQTRAEWWWGVGGGVSDGEGDVEDNHHNGEGDEAAGQAGRLYR